MTRTAKTMRLLGGRLCLDFVNSADWSGGDVVLDMLERYSDVVDFGERLSMLAASDARALRARGRADPRRAQDALARVRRARAELYMLFDGIARGATIDEAAVRFLDAELRETCGGVRLARSGKRLVCRPVTDDDFVAWLLGPVLWSATDLLLSQDLGRVRQCPGGDCEWLFVDQSRNRTRRWCCMETCGNRAKARTFYARKDRANAGSRPDDA